MKKRILPLLTAAVLLLLMLPLSFAGGDGYYYDDHAYWDSGSNCYMYSDTHYGIVICKQMKVRNTPSTGGKEYGQIRNGQPVKIIGYTQKKDFYLVDLASCGFKAPSPGAWGYAKTSLIKIDPEYIATTKLTNLYATPWSTDIKNGEQANRFFLIISSNKSWYAVQASESTPGSAFIRARDVGRYSKSYYSTYVVTWDTALYDYNLWHQIQKVKRYSVGVVTETRDEYSLIVFNEGKSSEYSGWILTQYIAPIIN